ncbi:MAG TPA: NADH:flavin oxidoreductase/NADH oxidase [Pirellulaceae bacterium]|jgi:2,4-dienoyl-CoA reductase-like NADH-dependent reductase (Old Yellow Enzyme family)
MTELSAMPMLFQPLALRAVTARNRIMISPMCQYCANDGVPDDWHFVHLGSRAVGGAGIVMTEATAVEPIGRITPYDLGLWNDEQEAAFARIAAFIAKQGALPGIQLAHAGRKASHLRPWEGRRPLLKEEGGWDVVGPSPLPWAEGDLVPHELTVAEIAALVEKYRLSAERGLRAGFKIVEIHAAHGYLLHSFLSPLSNQRKDEYGGAIERRARLLIEVVAAVRSVWPAEFPLFVRVSATDWADGGWKVEDTVLLARELGSRGVDVIDCSSGGTVPEQQIPNEPGYQVPLAEIVRRDAGVKSAAVGLISTATQAEEVLNRGQADLVVLGRIALWDPYWPYHAAKELGVKLEMPIQYARSGIYA